MLQCTDLDAGTLSLLTTFDGDTNLHVVPLWSITQKAMADTLRRLKGRFNMVVGFRPTGWSLGRGQHLGQAWACLALYWHQQVFSRGDGVTAQGRPLAEGQLHQDKASVMSRLGVVQAKWWAAASIHQVMHFLGDRWWRHSSPVETVGILPVTTLEGVAHQTLQLQSELKAPV